MKTYTHILFDLDHTLWDFEKNSEETLYSLFDQFGLGSFGKFDSTSFYNKYKFVNTRLWDLYNKGRISQKELRESRFVKTLTGLGLLEHEVPTGLSEAYIDLCPTKTAVFPYTYEVLEYLQPKYGLHIITNGFKEVQHVKMNSSRLHGYFREIVTSECCGFKKPDRRMFEHLLERINVLPADCLMIGDNYECDIEGARAAGIDQVYFNPEKVKGRKRPKPTYEISCLSELKQIL
ncbi:putative hydrolase of the HAD superfamily [Pontibacter ummariensis]|uniref:Putative hydrolase of the HAD superfamily n=1 Tax=Pontibacter ummariensis TaxID=1610492 RepID=A0A239HS57_9BACT|nr:YjjG family noncanonical pyrimidine nucleotidase [Pontibacter ummariensis]PRY10363.1 putative hydrolase of the HAD superfamily [Pontibacter ummariensis]SNS83114.1 putative hydrolase of the HAD superfamily [Pontibacter ummariensis]